MFLSPSLGTRKGKTKYRAPFRLIKIPSSSFFFPNVLLIFSTRFKVKFSSNDPLEINKEESKATMIIIIIVIREVITKGEREGQCVFLIAAMAAAGECARQQQLGLFFKRVLISRRFRTHSEKRREKGKKNTAWPRGKPTLSQLIYYNKHSLCGWVFFLLLPSLSFSELESISVGRAHGGEHLILLFWLLMRVRVHSGREEEFFSFFSFYACG